MAANTIPIFPLAARLEVATISNSDTTSKKLLFTAGIDGSRINSIGVSSTDTAAATIMFYLSKDSGSTFYLLGTIAISAAYQGLVQSGIPCFDSSKGIAIPVSASIYVAALATVTADKTLNFSALGSDY